ncbi:MAG: hypothetical protein K2Q22_02225 [Cytophagales bacterium]|nr:hypothetical protein [Cytophagales bacterium]
MKTVAPLTLLILLFLSSCIVQSPKYTSLNQVMSLKLGMSKAEVEKILDLEPYDLRSYTDTSSVFVYVYRITDRKTLSFDTRKKNGIRSTGKYVQLAVGYSKLDTVISIESCHLCPDNLVTQSKVDLEKVFIFITINLPVILVFIGLKF